MKLVDILARELKVWPDNNLGNSAALFVAQDRDGMLVTLDPQESPNIIQFNGSNWNRSHWTGGDLLFEVAEDCATAIVTRAEWQAAVDALKAPKVVEWNGEGLPPVGIVCELKSASKFTEGARLEEFPAGTRMLVGGCANFGGHDVAVVCVEGRHFCGTIIPDMLRPIRTPDQIAAEERTKAIDDLVRVTCINRGEAARIYDAGYRKFEIVEGEE